MLFCTPLKKDLVQKSNNCLNVDRLRTEHLNATALTHYLDLTHRIVRSPLLEIKSLLAILRL